MENSFAVLTGPILTVLLTVDDSIGDRPYVLDCKDCGARIAVVGDAIRDKSGQVKVTFPLCKCLQERIEQTIQVPSLGFKCEWRVDTEEV